MFFSSTADPCDPELEREVGREGEERRGQCLCIQRHYYSLHNSGKGLHMIVLVSLIVLQGVFPQFFCIVHPIPTST